MFSVEFDEKPVQNTIALSKLHGVYSTVSLGKPSIGKLEEIITVIRLPGVIRLNSHVILSRIKDVKGLRL